MMVVLAADDFVPKFTTREIAISFIGLFIAWIAVIFTSIVSGQIVPLRVPRFFLTSLSETVLSLVYEL